MIQSVDPPRGRRALLVPQPGRCGWGSRWRPAWSCSTAATSCGRRSRSPDQAAEHRADVHRPALERDGRDEPLLVPFAIGLSFIMPVELAFSCWFFFLVDKAQQVLGTAFGYDTLGSRLSLHERPTWGASLGILLVTPWTSRRYLAGALWGGVRRNGGSAVEPPRCTAGGADAAVGARDVGAGDAVSDGVRRCGGTAGVGGVGVCDPVSSSWG